MKKYLLRFTLTFIFILISATCFGTGFNTTVGQDEIDAMGATKQNTVTEGSLGKVILGEDVVDETIGATQLAKATKKTSQTVSMATGTLTLTAGYERIDAYVTGTSEPYTSITMSETGVIDGALAWIVNKGAPQLYFADDPNVLEMTAGPVYLTQDSVLALKYFTDRWVYIAHGSAIELASSIDLSPSGIVTGAGKGYTAAAGTSLEESQMNSTVLHTGAGLSYFTAGDYVSGAITSLEAKQTGIFAIEWFSNDASDQFVLSNGSLTTAGHSLTTLGLAGSGFQIKRLADHKWYVTNENGACIDGGAPPGFTLVDQFGGASGDTDDGSKYFAHGGSLYISSNFTVTSSATIIRIDVKLTKIGTPNLNTTAYIYNIATGLDKPTGSAIATSTNVINTVDITGTEYKTYLFSGIALATNGGTDGDGKFCLVLYGPEGGTGNYPYARLLSTSTGDTIAFSADASTWYNYNSNTQITFRTYRETP